MFQTEPSKTKPILVLGGTGKTGRRVIERLNARGIPTRSGSRSGKPPFDWTDWSTWAPVVRGARSVYVSYYPDLAATGAVEAVSSFAELAFANVGINLVWEGEGVSEKGMDASTGDVLIEIDPRYFRPAEVDLLIGDPSKAYRKLGWKHETKLSELCEEMVREDLLTVAKEQRRNAD